MRRTTTIGTRFLVTFLVVILLNNNRRLHLHTPFIRPFTTNKGLSWPPLHRDRAFFPVSPSRGVRGDLRRLCHCQNTKLDKEVANKLWKSSISALAEVQVLRVILFRVFITKAAICFERSGVWRCQRFAEYLTKLPIEKWRLIWGMGAKFKHTDIFVVQWSELFKNAYENYRGIQCVLDIDLSRFLGVSWHRNISASPPMLYHNARQQCCAKQVLF